MFRAFLDESGTHENSPVIIVAGYVARPPAWRKFEAKWQRTLHPIKVFHSNECNGFHCEWEGWSKPDRDAKVKKLLPIVRDIDGVGLAIGVVLKDVNEALSQRPDLLPYWGNPYESCFHWWIGLMLKLMQERGNREPLAVVHEQNQYADEANRAFKWHQKHNDPHGQLVSFSFGAKEKFVPLQAADILAYEANRRLQNIEGTPRKPFDVLMRENTEPLIRFYDKENLGPLIAMLDMARLYDEAERMEKLAPALVRRPT